MSVDIILGIILFCVFGVCGVISLVFPKREKTEDHIV
uniref:Uncharacterized protein n=1 Tax=viral metagenome TaxID=1070528 RepID=A0A6C0DJ88_9ZZZZ